MKKTQVKNNSKSLQALALNKAQLMQVKGGQNNFIIDDSIAGFKPTAPTGTPKSGFIIEDQLSGI